MQTTVDDTNGPDADHKGQPSGTELFVGAQDVRLVDEDGTELSTNSNGMTCFGALASSSIGSEIT